MPTPRRMFFEGQLIHLLGVAVLLVAVCFAAQISGFDQGLFLGLSTTNWVVLAIANAVLHQVYVWLCWRLELGGQQLTRIFTNRAFPIYSAGFAILIALRPLLALAVAWSNRSSLPLTPWVGWTIAALLILPVGYLMYSVRKYFGFDRAFGIDHFDPNFRDIPFVRQGIFRWSNNAMYVFGFLVLWVPAFLFQSTACLIVAGFSHAYIWVHYYCTEVPDMNRIYGAR